MAKKTFEGADIYPDDDPLYADPVSPGETDSPARAVRLAKAAKKRVAEPEPVEESESASGAAVDLPDWDDDPQIVAAAEEESTVEDDTFDSAIQMAFLGAGQGGGRIAQAFYDMGYRRVCAVNTTDQDLVSLTMKHKLVIGHDRGGAGKDPESGKLAAEESYEDVMDLLMHSWGEGIEQMYVCVGAGGGSGTGSWPVLVNCMREFGKSTNVEKPMYKHLGVIMSLPKRSEGSRVQANAHAAVTKALDMLEKDQIASLVIVDNARIHELFPGLPVKKFWQAANRKTASVLHTFNVLAAQNSEYNTFDKADFRSVVRRGLMIFGMTRVSEWQGKEDISKAVRQNLKDTLLAEGFDLSTADMAGAIVVAHDDVLSEIPMENIDYAFASLGRALGNESITLHNGIYEGRGAGMAVFTIVSGLSAPTARLQELEALAR
jgi:cell division GTPase FtsZ